MNVGGVVRRFLSHWHRATPEARVAGLDWYPIARGVVRQLAHESGCSVDTAAGVVAALSPRITWTRNVGAAREVLRGALVVPGCLSASLRKARRVAAGESPDGVLGGRKVRAFYAALMGDDSAPVVDIWVMRAAGLKSDAPTPRVYDAIARALSLVAARVGAPLARVQAVVWVVARRRAGRLAGEGGAP